jgi:hypothetical protein
MTQQPTAAGNTTPAVPMTAEQRAAFDRDGYLISGRSRSSPRIGPATASR